MIRLYTSFYPEQNPLRRQEILKCLKQNLETPEIDAVCLLLEETEPPFADHPKLKTRHIEHRPQYQDYFDWANELVQSNADTTIVANSDIWFDASIAALARVLKPDQCAALARWDVQPDGSSRLYDRRDSQDVWVFRGKLRPVTADFEVGIPRCDNRILYELRSAGYDVINPAFSVRTYHLHTGDRDEYPKTMEGLHVPGPYELLWPHNLLTLPITALYRLLHPETRLGWRLDRRKLRSTLPGRVVGQLKRLVRSAC